MVVRESTLSSSPLTERQKEIMVLMSKGLTNREIAAILDISANTVKVHVANILQALEVTNRTEAISVFTEEVEQAKMLDNGVAIIPFQKIGDNSRTEFLALGLVQDLSVRLGKWRCMPVISIHSTAHYDSGNLQVSKIRSELQVRYIVCGSLQATADTVRVSVYLLDTDTGQQLWAQTYQERFSNDVFAMQDSIAAAIVMAVYPELLNSEQKRYLSDTGSMETWGLSMRGLWHLEKWTPPDNGLAGTYFHRACELDDQALLPHYGISMVNYGAVFHQWTSDPVAARTEMEAAALRCMEIDPVNAFTLTAFACTHLAGGRLLKAKDVLASAVESNPSFVQAHSLLGQALIVAGQPAEGIRVFKQAIRLSPFDPKLWTFQVGLAMAHFIVGDYEQAVSEATVAYKRHPGLPLVGAILAAGQAQCGEKEGARTTISNVIEQNPRFSITNLMPFLQGIQKDAIDRFLAGLRMAGL